MTLDHVSLLESLAGHLATFNAAGDAREISRYFGARRDSASHELAGAGLEHRVLVELEEILGGEGLPDLSLDPVDLSWLEFYFQQRALGIRAVRDGRTEGAKRCESAAIQILTRLRLSIRVGSVLAAGRAGLEAEKG